MVLPPAFDPHGSRWRWAFLAAMAILAVAGFSALHGLARLSDASARVEHTNAVLAATSDLLLRLTDAETGQRGFLLTGDDDFLAPHEAAVRLVHSDVERLLSLTKDGDDDVQQARATDLQALAERKLREMATTIDLYRAGLRDEATRVVLEGEGQRLMDDIRHVAREMDDVERAQLREREARVAEVRSSTLLFVMLTALAAIAVGVVAAIVNRRFAVRNAALAREVRDRQAAQAAERLSEERLRIAVRAAPVTVYSADREGRYTWMEKPYPGMAADDLIGRRDDEVFPAEASTPLAALKAQVMSTGVSGRATIALPTGGALRTYDVTGEPLRGEGGAVVGLTVAAFDVTPLQEAQNELAARERFTRRILDTSGDCIQVLGPDGRILSTNPAGRRLLELADDEPAADAMWEAQWAEGAEEARAALEIALAGDQGRFRGRAATRGGGSRWFDVILTAVPGGDGGATRVVSIARDITDQQRAEAEREAILERERAARAEAERAGRAKDEFVATLSHELRTPLNAILGWTHILRQDRSAATVERGFAVIERNIRLQAQMIDDLLDMNRILSGKIRLEVQRTSLADVIESALASLEPAASARGIRITTVLGAVGPINGDPARLQQIVWNLVSNAVKFTPKGGRVGITLTQVDSYASIVVTDTGEGIAPDFLPHVFERFRQADGSTSRVHGGLGLGLAIVKQLVELHGGTVSADSAGVNQGATFTVRLPLALGLHSGLAEGPDARQAWNGAEPLPALTGLRILVCDDEADAREVVQRLLSDRGATVTVAGSVSEALQWVRQGGTPDVIVSDIGMPREDGYELIRQVRANPATAGVPAAALTALARPEDRRRVLLAGYQTHVAKPVEPSELVAVVASLAGRTGRASV
jgi:PAS domain S-box-containing protein